MSNDQTNPYAPTANTSETDGFSNNVGPVRDAFATRGQRFAAAFIDGLLLLFVLIPLQMVLGITARAAAGQMTMGDQILGSVLWVFAFLLFHGYTLKVRGQSLGKIALKIQIVDFETREIPSFVQVFVMRYLWTLPLAILVACIPGQIDDLVVNFAMFGGLLLIFGASQRCLHDYIAGTQVVVYHPSRNQ